MSWKKPSDEDTAKAFTALQKYRQGVSSPDLYPYKTDIHHMLAEYYANKPDEMEGYRYKAHIAMNSFAQQCDSCHPESPHVEIYALGLQAKDEKEMKDGT